MSNVTAIKEVRQIRDANVNEFGMRCSHWDARADAGTPFSDVLNPAYWAHAAAKIHMHDMINIRAEDGAWRAILTVTGLGLNWVKVVPMVFTEIDAPSAVKRDAKYKVMFRGPKRHSVIRVSDNAIMQEDIGTKADAEAIALKYEAEEAA